MRQTSLRSNKRSPISITRSSKPERVLKNSAAIRHHLTKSFFAFATLLLLTACPSAPVKNNAGTDLGNAGFGAQSLSANLFVDKDAKSYKLKCDVNVINERSVRLDLATTL